MNNRNFLSRSTFFNCVGDCNESKSLYMGDGTESLRRHKYINHRIFDEGSNKCGIKQALSLKFDETLVGLWEGLRI